MHRLLTHSLVARVIGCLMLAVLFLFPSSSASADTGVLVGNTNVPKSTDS